MQNSNSLEVEVGDRFAFGANWTRFLAVLNARRIRDSEQSLSHMLGVNSLSGKRFLDAGSGSGLFSLAARRLGATVVSFDYDAQSVACTAELQRRYFPDDPNWIVQQGSVLDERFLESLGQFDVVYSWGVLHHTGDMWRAFYLTSRRVSAGGLLFISIYNDQGGASRRWKKIKRAYNVYSWARPFILAYVFWKQWWITIAKDTLAGTPLRSWKEYGAERGMSPWHDVVDWAGGYPFEVAAPELIFRFYRDRGFQLRELTTSGGGIACNQYLFSRELET